METIHKFIYLTFYSLLLCLGLNILMVQIQSINGIYEVLEIEMKEDNLTNSSIQEEPQIPEVTYSQLMCTLIGSLEYDIEINGLLINKSQFIGLDSQTYNIARTNYEKQYKYDQNGKIIKIVYTSK